MSGVEKPSTPKNGKVALITGITGQDGSYLTELLESKGYEIHGISRSKTSLLKKSYRAIYHNVTFHFGELSDSTFIKDVVKRVRPHEIFSMGAHSNVGASWLDPEYVCKTNALGVVVLLEAIRESGLELETRLFQAGTSEMFGKCNSTTQCETTSFAPSTPYAVSKVHAYWTVGAYREKYGMFLVNGILFNHESCRRASTFRTRKLADGIAEVVLGKAPYLSIGDPSTRRDWGHARDFARVIWLSLQASSPGDYVFATGRAETLRYFVQTGFRLAGMNIQWEGSGIDEVGVDEATGRVVVLIDQVQYGWPSHSQKGNPSSAERILGWQREFSLEDTIQEIVDSAISASEAFGKLDETTASCLT